MVNLQSSVLQKKGEVMFAPKVAKPQTKTESPSARLAPQCSTLAGHRLGHDSLEQPLLLQRAIGNQATLPVIVQPKLEIGAVDDPLEHEADRVADQVMCMPGQVARDGLLQRKCSRCEEEDKLQRWSTSAPVRETAGGATVHEEADQGAALPLADLGEDLAASRGHPLDPATRTFMESRFGYDFSRVRLHADEAAAASAR